MTYYGSSDFCFILVTLWDQKLASSVGVFSIGKAIIIHNSLPPPVFCLTLIWVSKYSPAPVVGGPVNSGTSVLLLDQATHYCFHVFLSC